METTEVLTYLSLACTFDERLSSLHLQSSKGDLRKGVETCVGSSALAGTPWNRFPTEILGFHPNASFGGECLVQNEVEATISLLNS